MITIVDYGMGNLGSISNMVKKVGGKSKQSSLKDEILSSEKLLLPGVGSFDQAMKNLESLQLIEAIKDVASKGIPIMGICLGMQLLADFSEEGVLPGLGLIKGRVLKFNKNNDLKVPHMGWNLIEYNPNCVLFNGFEQFEVTKFYFVHSYYFKCDLDENIAGTTNYGNKFTSAVYNQNVMGVQFHPEKSHKYGMRMIRNLIDL